MPRLPKQAAAGFSGRHPRPLAVMLALHGVPAAALAAGLEGLIGAMRTSKRLSSRIATAASAAAGMTLSGVLFGGWWCDALTRWFGQRWGRRLPIVIGSLVGAVAYVACPLLGSAVGVAVACGIVAFDLILLGLGFQDLQPPLHLLGPERFRETDLLDDRAG